jgi:hypothetical protein
MPAKLIPNASETAAEKPSDANSREPTPQNSKPASTKPAENKFDPFHPDMPHIPGVGAGQPPDSRTSKGPAGPGIPRLLQFAGIGIVVLLLVASIVWWVKSGPRGKSDSAPDAEVADQPVTAPPPAAAAPVVDGPTVAASVDELSRPWSAKRFNFVKPITRENIPAMVMRLPGSELWAFSLQSPTGRCQLEFVTDLAALASSYQYHASHPMVVSPCDRTVFDPTKVGELGGNTWVRGEIVQGSGLRPPISIDVKVRDHSIIADSIE